MLEFKNEGEIRAFLKDYDVDEDLDLMFKNAQDLNQLMYPKGYTGAIRNPIEAYVDLSLIFYKLIRQNYEMRVELNELEEQLNNSEEKDKKIENRVTLLKQKLEESTALIKLVREEIEQNQKYIEKNIDEMPENKEKATKMFSDIKETRDLVGRKSAKKVENKQKINNTNQKALPPHEEKRNNSIINKLKNGFKTIKKKVVAVKDFAVAHKKEIKKGVMVVVALAGLTSAVFSIGNAIAFGSPLIIPARIVGCLWHPLHHIGLGNQLHGINEFLIGNLKNGVFNQVTGQWTVAGKIINNLNPVEMVADNLLAAAVLAAAGYGIFKVGKYVYKKVKGQKEEPVIQTPEDPITPIDFGIPELPAGNQPLFPPNEQPKLPSANSLTNEQIQALYQKFNDLSEDELSQLITYWQGFINQNKVPRDYEKQMTFEQFVDVFKIIKDVRNQKQKLTPEEAFAQGNNEECSEVLAYLENQIQNWYKNGSTAIGMKINGHNFDANSYDEAVNLYNKLSGVYNEKFGGRTL